MWWVLGQFKKNKFISAKCIYSAILNYVSKVINRLLQMHSQLMKHCIVSDRYLFLPSQCAWNYGKMYIILYLPPIEWEHNFRTSQEEKIAWIFSSKQQCTFDCKYVQLPTSFRTNSTIFYFHLKHSAAAPYFFHEKKRGIFDRCDAGSIFVVTCDWQWQMALWPPRDITICLNRLTKQRIHMDGVWDLLNTIFYKSCGTTYYLLVLALTLLQILLSSIAIRKPWVYEFFYFAWVM